jgi:hypothetical protein
MTHRKTSAAIIPALIFSITCRVWAAGPAPFPSLPWLHVGLQISYLSKSSYTPGNTFKLFSDPNGNLQDQNGNMYSAMEQQGSAAVGIIQWTVAGTDGTKAVLSMQNYLINTAPNIPPGTPPSQLGITGAFQESGSTNFGALWIAPPALMDYLKVPRTPSVNTVRMPWKVGDTTYDSVAIASYADKYYSISVYDIKTGLLIHKGTTAQGAAPVAAMPGDTPRGSTFIQIMDLAQLRDVNIPWANEPMPATLATTKILHFHLAITNHFFKNTPPIWITGRLDDAITGQGNGWVAVDQTSKLDSQPNMPVQPTKMLFGCGQFMGLWAGPLALGELKAGQALDEDPLTSEKTVVSSIDDNSVVITQSNAAVIFDCRYDRHTGMLIGTRRMDNIGKGETQTQFQGQE